MNKFDSFFFLTFYSTRIHRNTLLYLTCRKPIHSFSFARLFQGVAGIACVQSICIVHMVHVFCVESFHRGMIHQEVIFIVALSDKSYNENVMLDSMGFLRSK